MLTGAARLYLTAGIPGYHYGYEALHGMIQNCPFADRLSRGTKEMMQPHCPPPVHM